MTDCNLVLLGNVHAPRSSILKQATKFIAKCYGISSDCETMTECRFKVWAKRVGTGKAAPKLRSLPPTSESHEQNVWRAHYQVATWEASLSGELPPLEATENGCFSDVPNKCLLPIYKAEGTIDAPASVLKLIRCGCQSDQPCNGSLCSL